MGTTTASKSTTTKSSKNVIEYTDANFKKIVGPLAKQGLAREEVMRAVNREGLRTATGKLWKFSNFSRKMAEIYPINAKRGLSKAKH